MRADIAQVRSAQRKDLPVGIECKLGLDGEISALIVAQEGLVALAGPLDGSADALRGPGDQRELGEERIARAEIAADLVCGHAHGGGRHAKDPGELPLLPHDAAAAGVQPVAGGRGIEAGNRRARLHRHAGDALDPGRQTHDMCRARERFLRGGAIAGIGVDAYIGKPVVQRRRAGLDRGKCTGDARQGLVIDLHALGRVHCRTHRLGNHHGHRLPDKADAVRRQWHMRRDRVGRAVPVLEQDIGRARKRRAVRDRPQAVSHRIPAREHRDHPRHCTRPCRRDGADARMRVRRAHHIRVGLARHADVVAVTACAGYEAQVLLAAQRLADGGVHGDTSSSTRPRVSTMKSDAKVPMSAKTEKMRNTPPIP